ncbi:MAG: hypothetical protein HYX24_00650 [Candidatus Aenigmarchaeota archaeon]|nr:hypothetical protein [Candidatus Aenigmarchaeota archaeon]
MKSKISVNSEKLLLKTLNLLPTERNIEDEKSGNFIRIRYYRNLPGGSNSKRLSVPKEIAITPELVKSLGIYYAEGDKSSKRWLTRFSNSEISVVLEGMNLFKVVGVGTNILKAYIRTYGFDTPDDELLMYWSEKTGIPKENFIKIARYKSKRKYERNRKPVPKYGVVEVYYPSVVVRDIVDSLLATVKILSLYNQEVGLNFLKGLIAREGSVKLHQNKIREIRIASCNENEQHFIRKLLKFVKVVPSNAVYDFYIAISGFDNFQKIKNLDILQIHPEKKKAFDYGFNATILTPGE